MNDEESVQETVRKAKHDIMTEYLLRHGDAAVVIQIRKIPRERAYGVHASGPSKWERETAILRFMAASLVTSGMESEDLYNALYCAFKGMVDAELPHNVRPGLRLVKPLDRVDLKNESQLEDVPEDQVAKYKDTPESLEADLNLDARRLAMLADIPDELPVRDGNKAFEAPEGKPE